MGQRSSSVKSGSFRSGSLRKSFMERKASLLRRGSKRELSATFNMYREDIQVEFLNINTATEEELMTLPGITRPIAHNIVDYRQAIGQFKKIEDLALVSGVGANKLALIRTEICVNISRRRRNSRTSSGGTRSEDSIGASIDNQEVKVNQVEHSSTNGGIVNGYGSNLYSYKLVDVNSANIFQLMTVRGVNQKIAANIVCYRERKGPFKSMDELTKVKGVGHQKINELRSYLCVNASDTTYNKYMPNGIRRSSSVPVTSNGSVVTDSAIPLNGALVELNYSDDFFDEKAVYEVLSSRCPRPAINDRFYFKRNEQPALRLGSWNLENFTLAKASNLGVIEVVCRTILETGISLIAFQDVRNSLALDRLCDELNTPYLSKIKSWVGPTGLWKYHISEPVNLDGQEPEYLAVLYDSCRGITVVKSETLHFTPSNNNDPTFPSAFYATFKVENIEFCVLSIHLSSENSITTSNTSMAVILATCLEKVKETSLLIVLGDFNADLLSKDFEMLSERFIKLIPKSSNNSKSEDFTYQDIWMSLSVQKFYTGYSGVVRKGLTHLTIPKGWGWGGSISSQSPIWAEFYVPSLMSLSVLSNAADLNYDDD